MRAYYVLKRRNSRAKPMWGHKMSIQGPVSGQRKMLVSLMCARVCVCVCVCVCVEKRWVRWSEEGKSSNLGRGRQTLWPHMPSIFSFMPSIFKLIKYGPGGTLGFVSRTLSLYQASIQDTEK